MSGKYGIESSYTQTDSEMFSEITSQMKEATQRSTYQPYFEMFQQDAVSDYFNTQSKAGQTGSGNFSGFAGSTSENSVMDSLMSGFGKQMFKVEKDIGQQQQKAETTINDIIQSNRQTALSLKQLEEGNKGGGSCFAKGTLILMSDGTEMPIEEVKAGDKIIGYTGEVNTVKELEINPLSDRDLYGFGENHFFTAEHPFLTIDGWKSLSPDSTLKENPAMDITKLQVGDKLFLGSKLEDLVGYIHIPVVKLSVTKRASYDSDMVVYNLLCDGNHTYHANGLVVHSIQPNFDSSFVRNGIKNLKKEEKQVLFQAVEGADDSLALLSVLGKAWGISVPKAFQEEMVTIKSGDK